MLIEMQEILPVVSLDEGEPGAVYNEEGRVCISINIRQLMVIDVKLEWGNVWTFTVVKLERLVSGK